MTLSTKIEVFLRILHLFAVGLHTCTAVARSLCVSWAFLYISFIPFPFNKYQSCIK